MSRRYSFVRQRSSLFALCGALGVILLSCAKPTGAVVRVDMSREHTEGRFMPELGDKISIAGSFNKWKPDSLYLRDGDSNWIYECNLRDVMPEERSESMDSLAFKFFVTPGEGRFAANQGWETIGNRVLSLARLGGSPLLVFNEPFDERSAADVTFTVGMNNQEVLGFFRPDQGDEVVVTGSFCNWSEKGLLMESADNDGVYAVKVPVRVLPDEQIEYKFRILSSRKTTLPNSGWETLPNRQHTVDKPSVEIPYAEFNDLRRVARFIINTEPWERKSVFRPQKGEILQIRLLLDGKESLSNQLIEVAHNTFETALSIPVTVRNAQWQIVKNGTTLLTEVKELRVDLRGTIVQG